MIVSLSLKPIIGKRPFIVSGYTSNERGIPRPQKPSSCPFATLSDASCTIHIERWRVRICGIRFAVAGMRCVTHKVSFTVYPPGWAPYARKALLLVDHGGCEVETEDQDNRWGDTVFEASADAAAEKLWPEEVQLGPLPEVGLVPQSRRTQRRHIAGVVLLLGLNQSATCREREIVARFMNIGVSWLEAGARKIRDGPSLIRKGVEAVQVLEQLQAIRLRMIGLLTLGTNQGFWGPALLQ